MESRIKHNPCDADIESIRRASIRLGLTDKETAENLISPFSLIPKAQIMPKDESAENLLGIKSQDLYAAILEDNHGNGVYGIKLHVAPYCRLFVSAEQGENDYFGSFDTWGEAFQKARKILQETEDFWQVLVRIAIAYENGNPIYEET